MKTSSRRDEGCPDGADAFDGEENDQVRSSSVMTRILTVIPLLASTAAAQTPTRLPVLAELFTSAGGKTAGRRPPHRAGVPGLETVARGKAGAPLAAARSFGLEDGWRRRAIQVVAFLQEKGGRVIAVARAGR